MLDKLRLFLLEKIYKIDLSKVENTDISNKLNMGCLKYHEDSIPLLYILTRLYPNFDAQLRKDVPSNELFVKIKLDKFNKKYIDKHIIENFFFKRSYSKYRYNKDGKQYTKYLYKSLTPLAIDMLYMAINSTYDYQITYYDTCRCDESYCSFYLLYHSLPIRINSGLINNNFFKYGYRDTKLNYLIAKTLLESRQIDEDKYGEFINELIDYVDKRIDDVYDQFSLNDLSKENKDTLDRIVTDYFNDNMGYYSITIADTSYNKQSHIDRINKKISNKIK